MSAILAQIKQIADTIRSYRCFGFCRSGPAISFISYNRKTRSACQTIKKLLYPVQPGSLLRTVTTTAFLNMTGKLF